MSRLTLPAEPLKVKVQVEQTLGANMVRGPRLTHRFAVPKMSVVAAFAVKNSGKRYIEDLGERLVRSIEPKTIHALGQLVVAGAFCYGQSLPAVMERGDMFIDSIARTPVDVTVSSSGKVTTSVGSGSRHGGRAAASRRSHTQTPTSRRTAKKKNVIIEVGNQVSVERTNGATIFHFDNLNIYVNAKFVNQLNMNVNEVVNNIKGQFGDVADAVEQRVQEELKKKKRDDEEGEGE